MEIANIFLYGNIKILGANSMLCAVFQLHGLRILDQFSYLTMRD